MRKNETKLYYYLTGALVCLILGMRRFLSTYQQFPVVVFCSLTMFLLLVALFYRGLTWTAHKGIQGHFRSLLALLASGMYLFVLMLPLGLFGFSNYIKFSVPISGAQFTWITVNRYPIALSAIIVYFVMASVGIYFSGYALQLIKAKGDQPIKALADTVKTMSGKVFLLKVAMVLGMLLGVCILIISLGWLNQSFQNGVVFFLSQGIIDIVAPIIEIVVIGWLLGIKFGHLEYDFLLDGFGMLLIIFAGLLAGVSPNFDNQPTAKPTIIVHRGVIDHNAQANTIAALKRNSRYHFPFVEMDVQETKDHYFICAHDDDVHIPGQGEQEINQLDLSTIQKYHHVDMFKDYLRTANQRKQPLIIELKVTNSSDRLMGTRFADQFSSQITILPHRVHSVGYSYLQQIKHQIPQVKIGLVTMLNFGDIGHYNVDFYTLQHLTANPFLIASVGKTGRPVYSWTDDSKLAMIRMEMLGTTGQVTDQALRLRRLHVDPQRDRWILLLNSLQNYL